MPESAPDKLALSILIRTFNEEDRIGKAIESALPLGGEVLVLDAGSTDRTVEIARALGARVIANKWQGFGQQRNYGEGQCAHDYIFSLDADEVVTGTMRDEIRAAFAREPLPKLFVVRKAMIFPGHERPTPFAFCHEQVLIYDRRVARTILNANWDKLEYDPALKPAKISEPLWHFSFRGWDHALGKTLYVARLFAKTSPIRSRRKLAVRLVFEFPLTFLKFYFLRRYFFGGHAGFLQAVVTAWGRFIRILLMYEAALKAAKKTDVSQ